MVTRLLWAGAVYKILRCGASGHDVTVLVERLPHGEDLPGVGHDGGPLAALLLPPDVGAETNPSDAVVPVPGVEGRGRRERGVRPGADRSRGSGLGPVCQDCQGVVL